jgi:hypothetical protein
MKRMTKISAVVIFVILAAAPSVRAQGAPATSGPATPAQAVQTPDVYELVLRDGSRVFGTVERENDQEVVFRTHGGATLTARRADIVTLRRVKGRIQEGEFMRSDEHRSRLFFAPTARSLQRGQVSVGVFEFFAPFVQVGVTDNFSIGGGTPLVFGIDEFDRPFWVTPKLQVFKGKRAQAAVGVLHVFAGSGDSAGIGYGVATFGSDDNAVTAGAGIAYAGDDQGALFMIGGERRVRSNLKLISENYITKSGNGIVSGGLRFIGGRLSADLALAVPLGLDDFYAFPVVNFMYVFK